MKLVVEWQDHAAGVAKEEIDSLRDEAFEEDFRACESHDRLSLSRARGALPLLLVGEGTKAPR